MTIKFFCLDTDPLCNNRHNQQTGVSTASADGSLRTDGDISDVGNLSFHIASAASDRNWRKNYELVMAGGSCIAAVNGANADVHSPITSNQKGGANGNAGNVSNTSAGEILRRWIGTWDQFTTNYQKFGTQYTWN